MQNKKNTIYSGLTRDAKANPNSTFPASVNLGSSRYFQQSINLANIGSNLNNTLISSISYLKLLIAYLK
jgi:hypothetical protein